MCSAFLILRYMFDDCNRLFIKKPSLYGVSNKRSNLIWQDSFEDRKLLYPLVEADTSDISNTGSREYWNRT